MSKFTQSRMQTVMFGRLMHEVEPRNRILSVFYIVKDNHNSIRQKSEVFLDVI